MCCISLTAQDTVATIELTGAVNPAMHESWLPENVKLDSVQMNWIVVTDDNNKRHLRMRWRANGTGENRTKSNAA